MATELTVDDTVNFVAVVASRDVNGNGIPNGNGNLMGIPWEWE